ncbi:hypothetical protein P389DRAFT_21000 [Cystobasidium minutum MCA 4210]|uniref:uncharacterized protein n=1 Tax=Cystobasidium minutum MCA 4210 TaxID=1397322 RepID=UPI0034CF9930|eukprot:jgi/Rhomi1/21000/CE20999_259
MQVAAMQHQQQPSSVYLGSNVPKLQSASSQTAAPTGNVKKWKNKLKTFLNSPLPGAGAGNANNNSSSGSNSAAATSSAISSTASTTGSSTASATPRPESQSPNDTIAVPSSSSFSRHTSPDAFAIADHQEQQVQTWNNSSTPKPDSQQQQQQTLFKTTQSTSTLPSTSSTSATTSTFQNDVYAGYDISVNYGNLANDLTINNGHTGEGSGSSSSHPSSGAGGPNDSYEARLSRLVGDLENVDYGSFANINAADDIHASSAKFSHDSNGGNHDGDIDSSNNDIRISTSLFKSQLTSGMDSGSYSNHPFAYASAGTPSHLDSSNGPSSSSSKPFSNNYLSNSLNFQNQFPLSSSPSSNGIINIEDALNSFSSSPYFNDFSAYTNLDDDLNTSGDIRIPSFDTPPDSSQAPTPSSSASVPLTAAPSASSNDSGSSTAATSEILLPHSDKSHRRHQSDTINTASLLPFSSLGSISLAAPLKIQQSNSMPFAPFQASSTSDDEDDDFAKLLRDSQIDSDKPSTVPFAASGGNGLTTLSGFQATSLPSSQSLATEAGGTPLDVTTFDLTMFPMPKSSTGTASVKMGSQPSSGSESSYGPSPALSYGGSSTSNTSFDDPNASKDSAPFTPKKSKALKNGKGNTKSLSISLEEAEPDTSIVTVSPGVKTPTHSPHPSISSMPPTPASYKTASSVPTSPYRPRPVIHASALAWRVAPPAHSPQSSITVDTTRTIRPVASQSFINTDPFASPTSPSRLSKLNTASSPELKRRRNTVDDDDLSSPSAPQSIDATLSTLRDDSLVAQLGNQTLNSTTGSPLRPIAYRRRVGHKFSNPQLQLPSSNMQGWQGAPALHQRQHSQPLPATAQVPLQYNVPSATMQNAQYQPQTNSQQLHTRQYTAPLPSPSTAALHYTQQQQQMQRQHQHQPQSQQIHHSQSQQFQRQQQQPAQTSTGNGAWLSDNIITNLISQLSDQTYMCLMQNCGQRFAAMDDIKSHITGHFAPQPVPLQQSSQSAFAQQPFQQQQQQAFAQYPMYNQGNQYPQSQQQTWI